MTKIQASLEAAGSDADVAPPASLTFRLIREGFAPKMGQHATGQIAYQVLTDDARTEVFLRINKNHGGGYVSDEAVAISSLVRCIAKRDMQAPLRSGIFGSAFAGRSSNNAGFMSAVLICELLIRRDADRPYILHDTGTWETWSTTQLAITGDLPIVRVGKAPVVQAGVAAPAPATADDPQDIETADIADPGHVPEDSEAPLESEPSRPGRKPRKSRLVLTA